MKYRKKSDHSQTINVECVESKWEEEPCKSRRLSYPSLSERSWPI